MQLLDLRILDILKVFPCTPRILKECLGNPNNSYMQQRLKVLLDMKLIEKDFNMYKISPNIDFTEIERRVYSDTISGKQAVEDQMESLEVADEIARSQLI